MAKGEKRGNREAKKPNKEKPKTIAAAASRVTGQSQGAMSPKPLAGKR
jgi:hypothetical protein